MSTLSIVQAQVDAFNAHDLEAFLTFYARDAVVVGVAPEPLIGQERLRAFYAPRLRDDSVHCTIDASVLFGERWVVARELVSTAGGVTETIATFDIGGGLIQRASMLKA